MPRPGKDLRKLQTNIHLNIDASILKILANWTHLYNKRTMHHGHGGLISRKQKWFNTWKSINMLYQMNRHHMIISTDAERAFDKNPTFLHNKNTRQTRKRRCYDLFLPVEHLWHQMCGVLPQANNQFSPNSPNTSWMTYNAFPFWHWLRGASTKLPKRRAQSHACLLYTSDAADERK